MGCLPRGCLPRGKADIPRGPETDTSPDKRQTPLRPEAETPPTRGRHPRQILPDTVNKRAVRNSLECIIVECVGAEDLENVLANL